MAAVAVVDDMITRSSTRSPEIAVALSIAVTLQRMSSPTIAALGELGESRNFVDVTYMPEARTDPQIIVLRPSQPLFFANAEATLSRIVGLVTSNAARVAILSLEDSDTLDSTRSTPWSNVNKNSHTPAAPSFSRA